MATVLIDTEDAAPEVGYAARRARARRQARYAARQMNTALQVMQETHFAQDYARYVLYADLWVEREAVVNVLIGEDDFETVWMIVCPDCFGARCEQCRIGWVERCTTGGLGGQKDDGQVA